MASTALEHVRETHEEIEELLTLASDALAARDGAPISTLGKRTPRTALEASQLARDLVDAAEQRRIRLKFQHSEPQSSLAECKRELRLGPRNQKHFLRPFYDRLNELRSAHRNSNDDELLGGEERTAQRNDALICSLPAPQQWNPEEAGGSCLDLHASHTAFLALLGKECDYVAYVRAAIVEPDALPAKARRSTAYLSYLDDLLEYLTAFAERIFPLDYVGDLVNKEMQRDEERQQAEREQLCARFRGNAEACLKALGLGEVTSKLNALALKAGGRPEDRAARLLNYAKIGTAVERVTKEAAVRYLCVDVLGEERVATAHNAEKKLALSYEELVRERADNAAAERGVVDEPPPDVPAEGDAVYNPKDVPLGWDGRPIPYWLYKLHGLNHSYRCEICGGAVYRGFRAFERHFSGARHVAGLRCLGIRYSKAFLMITSIADAVALHARLSAAEAREAPDSVECEDATGNVSVLKRKTVEDLAKQGLY